MSFSAQYSSGNCVQMSAIAIKRGNVSETSTHPHAYKELAFSDLNLWNCEPIKTHSTESIHNSATSVRQPWIRYTRMVYCYDQMQPPSSLKRKIHELVSLADVRLEENYTCVRSDKQGILPPSRGGITRLHHQRPTNKGHFRQGLLKVALFEVALFLFLFCF